MSLITVKMASMLMGQWNRLIFSLAALLVGLTAPAGMARACGYEDPTTIAIGALNFAYPQALYVGTAVWQAQMDGRLPRGDPAAVTSDDPLRRQAAAWEVMRLNERLRAFFDRWPQTAELPAVVFVDTGLWTRFVRKEARVTTLTHQSGPAGEAVVLVTMPVALRALLDGRSDFAAAVNSGIMRAYGDEAAQEAVRQAWHRTSTEKSPE